VTLAGRPVSFVGVRLFVFDLDGTLVDSATDLAAAVNDTIARLVPEAEPLSLQQVRAFVGNGARRLILRSFDAAEIEADVEAALPVFLDCYRTRLLETTRLYPGVVEALAHLSDRSLAVLTNKPGDMSRTILRGLGVADRFVAIVGGGDGPEHKPDPAGLLGLVTRVGVRHDETVMVGDSSIDVETGRRAGVRTVGVTYGFAPEGLQTTPPDVLLDDLRELVSLAGPPGMPVLR
jgi:phosphoglycolate phosphatase